MQQYDPEVVEFHEQVSALWRGTGLTEEEVGRRADEAATLRLRDLRAAEPPWLKLVRRASSMVGAPAGLLEVRVRAYLKYAYEVSLGEPAPDADSEWVALGAGLGVAWAQFDEWQREAVDQGQPWGSTLAPMVGRVCVADYSRKVEGSAGVSRVAVSYGWPSFNAIPSVPQPSAVAHDVCAISGQVNPIPVVSAPADVASSASLVDAAVPSSSLTAALMASPEEMQMRGNVTLDPRAPSLWERATAWARSQPEYRETKQAHVVLESRLHAQEVAHAPSQDGAELTRAMMEYHEARARALHAGAQVSLVHNALVNCYVHADADARFTASARGADVDRAELEREARRVFDAARSTTAPKAATPTEATSAKEVHEALAQETAPAVR
jgi:hypothetical protein